MVSLAAWGSALTTSPMTICFMVYGLYFLREFTAQELPPPAHYPYGDEAPLMFSLDSSNTHASPLRKVGFSSIVRTNIAMPIANLRHFCLAALGYPVTTQRRQLFSSVRTSRVSRNRMPPTLRELSPRSPTSRAFSPNHDHGEDDTISNASSAYTDALASPQGADIEPNDSQHSEARRDVDQDVDRKYHVTELSRAPSALLSFWLDRMIISWLFAPLEHLALRALAGAFLSGGLRTTGSQAQNAKAIVESMGVWDLFK
ncbi:MAG: hypothetical protein M1820_008429 [Bogoriella megaspora]|nr:MAG: hypothetical protein M1820_008429 [Bogoriella megaspora]